MKQHRKAHLTFVLLCSLFWAQASTAATIVQDRAKLINRLVPLEKITVGPDDQYNAAVDPSGQTVVFTHKADLVAHLEMQEIATGITMTLLPTDADSEEPSFSPDGRLAFTYYKFNARGDICYAMTPKPPLLNRSSLAAGDIHCLKRSADVAKTQRANSFWKSAKEIGFVEREITSQNTRVVSVNIESGAETVIAEGRLWSPNMLSGGRYLTFNEWIEENAILVRHIVVIDLQTGKRQVLKFALPGISGFPQISDGEQFLYFSHYMTDTNGDQIIDGNDNAVVFRIPMAKISQLSGQTLFPEQLTSVESSCSFPKPFQKSIFLTCAFEGSLDIYRAPESGIVPTSWTEPLITNALQTSRSYEDRVLLLNALQYRFQKPELEVDEKLLSDHLLANDMEAARYYIDALRQGAGPNDASFYDLLRIYITGRELKLTQSSDQIGREFSRKILALDQQIEKMPVGQNAAMRAIVRGELHSFINQWREAASFVSQVQAKQTMRPLERHLYFELASHVTAQELPQNLPQLLQEYSLMMKAPELSEQSQIHYAFEMLTRLQGLEPDVQKRITMIEGLDHDLPAACSSLMKSEIAVLHIILVPDDQKANLYPPLDKLIVAARPNYYLRRALYVRAINNFSKASDFLFMRFIVNAWLRDTALSDTEEAYAREALSGAAYDQAYASYGKKNYLQMDNYFYDAIGITDELEAHYGYIQAMVLEGKRSQLEFRYKNLREHGFVVESMHYVDAVLDLIDGAAKADKDPHAVDFLDRAIVSLGQINEGRVSAVRYLLLGYCYMEKVLRQADGLAIPNDLFQNANHNLMLAYDLGRENDRVKAAALMNLGILHQRAQNHGQAAKFFALRKKLGFNTEVEHAAFTWLYAKSLEHSHQEELASAEIAALPPAEMNPALTEREAFDLTTARKFKEAAQIYAQVFKSGAIQGDRNLAKVNLSYGYVLFKLERFDEAKTVLKTSLAAASRLKATAHDDTQLVDFDPLRIELAASGLLGQIGSPQERAAALEERAKYLAHAKNVVDDWQGLTIENEVQLAAAQSSFDLAKAAESMQEALKVTENFADAGQAIGNTVFRSAVNYLAHAIQHPALYQKDDGKRVQKVVERALQAYESQKIEQPLLQSQDLELKILWNAYQRKVLKRSVAVGEYLNSAIGEKLKASLPRKFAELEALEKVFEK